MSSSLVFHGIFTHELRFCQIVIVFIILHVCTTLEIIIIKNYSLGNNKLAIVNTLKYLIAIKSDEQCINELSLYNVNYLIHTQSTD